MHHACGLFPVNLRNIDGNGLIRLAVIARPLHIAELDSRENLAPRRRAHHGGVSIAFKSECKPRGDGEYQTAGATDMSARLDAAQVADAAFEVVLAPQRNGGAQARLIDDVQILLNVDIRRGPLNRVSERVRGGENIIRRVYDRVIQE